MKRNIITTADGSKTIHIEDWNEPYHSIHGAMNEAQHVFIKHGLHFYMTDKSNGKEIAILEIGFGTGLNAFLTLLEAESTRQKIQYTGVEAYPIPISEVNALNYSEFTHRYNALFFEKLHHITWDSRHNISNYFTLEKQRLFFEDIKTTNTYNIIYFDAFGARVQPHLWTETIFKIMYDALKRNGVLVTYSAKGSVRRAMQNIGFSVEKLPGPPGKREMLRARKTLNTH